MAEYRNDAIRHREWDIRQIASNRLYGNVARGGESFRLFQPDCGAIDGDNLKSLFRQKNPIPALTLAEGDDQSSWRQAGASSHKEIVRFRTKDEIRATVSIIPVWHAFLSVRISVV